MPTTPWNVRIEHRFGGETYYFFNTDAPKARQTTKADGGREGGAGGGGAGAGGGGAGGGGAGGGAVEASGTGGIILTSRRVCFSSDWSYQNILKVD